MSKNSRISQIHTKEMAMVWGTTRTISLHTYKKYERLQNKILKNNENTNVAQFQKPFQRGI